MPQTKVPFRRLASEFLKAAGRGDAPAWRSVGDLLDRNFEEITNVLGVERVLTGKVGTADATPKTIITIKAALNTSYGVSVTVVARRTAGAGAAEDGAYYVRYAGVTMAGGTATLMTSVSSTVTHEDVVGWEATIVMSGGEILVQVTGAAATDIAWYAVARVISVSV